MDIKLINIENIKPYSRNPRKNDTAVKYVRASIEEFGFKVPVVLDRNNVIVAGHTRFKAAQEIGLQQIPCIIADDLTDEQIKAFRLADNKVAEQAEWDFDLLDDELLSIWEINMQDFGFDEVVLPDEQEVDEESENERQRTADAYNLDDFNEYRAVGFYQMPIIEGINHIPEDLIGFNYMLNSDKYDAGIHFFVDDYQFERIWNNPHQYTHALRQYDCMLTPDFSLYMDMPMAMKVWNIYRSRLIGQIFQEEGLRVIPTVSWAEKETFTFCFDGLPSESTLAVSTIGVKRSKEATQIWFDGMNECIKRTNPKNIICYGGDIGFDFGNINVKFFNNHVTENMKALRKEQQ